LAYRTTRLRELIAVLSFAEVVVCSDGGAMHIAAGLQKPIVSIWGSTNRTSWKPWGVRNIILQDKSNNAADVSVENVSRAIREIQSNNAADESIKNVSAATGDTL